MTQEQSLEMQSCTELRPANVYDIAANETWLEDLARQGWRLTGMTGWSGVFQRAEPAVCRYRMQPLSRKEKTPPEDVIELYAALGWEYVCTLAGRFHIWRCDDPETPELDTDPVVQGMGYRYLKKRMVWDTIQTGVLFLVLVGLYAWGFQIRGTPLLDALNNPPGELAAGAGAYGLALFLMLCQIRSMGRLLRSLRAGVALKRPKPYRRQKWLARGLLACVVLFLGLGFLGSLRNIRGSSLAGGWDTGDSRHVPKAGVVYVDLRDLEGAEQTEFWSCRTKVHELCPRLYETRQLSLGEGEGPLRPGDSYPVLSSAETTHYRLLTESLARRLTRELSRGRTSSLGVYGHPALAAAETDGLDELWWGEDRYDQFVLARLGRQVIFLRYEGETDLRQAGAYFTALLDP
nr:DUF2812 domain-containing protein [uncultured Dysosmobacter sp.]